MGPIIMTKTLAYKAELKRVATASNGGIRRHS
jgi:hypothetical protein